MPSVLFVCSANRYRSPLAAGLFRKALEEEEQHPTFDWPIGSAMDWEVASAGTWAVSGQPVLPEVLLAARQLGLDLSHHRSLPVSEALLSAYDLILVMQGSHRDALRHEFPQYRERVYLLSRVVEYRDYDIEDAYGSAQEVSAVCAAMNTLIRRGLRYICILAIALHNERMRAG